MNRINDLNFNEIALVSGGGEPSVIDIAAMFSGFVGGFAVGGGAASYVGATILKCLGATNTPSACNLNYIFTVPGGIVGSIIGIAVTGAAVRYIVTPTMSFAVNTISGFFASESPKNNGKKKHR